MYDATSRFDAAGLQRARGAAAISFARRGGRTALTGLYQQTPCRVMFPEPEEGDPPLAVLLTTSGGLTGGDDIRIAVSVEDGAAVVVSTQAAEKIYRSLGPDVTIEVVFDIAGDARLEYYPQETILFDGARLRRCTEANIAPGGNFAAAEMLVFGRQARGERLTRGYLLDGWRVRRDGRLVWVDRLALDDDIAATLDDPFALDGAVAIATALHVGANVTQLLPEARDLADGAATIVNGLLVARIFGPSPQEVRDRLTRYLSEMRGLMGLAPRLPRVWHV